MTEKVKIRGKLCKWRTALDAELAARKSGQILHTLEELPEFKTAQNILLYYSVNNEVDTRLLIEKYIDSKHLFLPVIKAKSHFQAVPISSPLNLQKGYEGVPEPVGEPNSVYDQSIDLIILPGVAFDRSGTRLGMGKGYYDRYLQRNGDALKIGLAYDEQVLDRVPKEPYDERVDMIISDKQVYRLK